MENTTSSSPVTETLASVAKRFTSHQLATDAQWASRAITLLYGFQTSSEQEAQATAERNGAGFNGTDAFILSSFAEQIAKGRSLSPKQLAIAFKKLPKYAGQVVGAVAPDKLDGFLTRASAWATANPPAPKAAKAEKPAEFDGFTPSRL
jgi:hypothetical protein